VRYQKYISIFLFLFVALTATVHGETPEAAHVKSELANVEKQFDPSPIVLHHIADSHEFDVLQLWSVPLPCILYNTATKGVTTFLYHEGKEVNGYKCEEGEIKREDGGFFIDMSITKNVFTMLLAAALLIFIFTSVAKAYTTNTGKAPSGLQSLIEPMFIFVRDDVAKQCIGPKYEKFLPYIMTIFFFILANNLLGLVPLFPGGANVSGNISFTIVLAVIAFIVVNFNGTKDYWMHIVWMPGVPVPMKIFLAPIELIGVIIKPVALMIRLFANMTAGHIIVLSLISLIFIFGKVGASLPGSGLGAAIAVPFTLFIGCIEVLVAFIQAFIFAMLTSVFIGLALEDHSSHDEAHAAH